VGLAWHLLGDEDAALDAAQDAFLRAFDRLRSLRDAGRFWPWLARIVVNRCRSIRRRERAGPELAPLGAMDLPGEWAVPDLDEPDRRRAVAEAVARLPDTQREAVVLFYYHDLPQEEVAAALGCSVGAVKARLFAARRRLAEDLAGWLE